MRKIALTACSNGLAEKGREQIDELTAYLHTLGVETVCSPCLYRDPHLGCSMRSAPGKARAEAINAFFADPSITEIYDVSGGEIANEVLPYLDFGLIRRNPKPFYGYSDLTSVVNALAIAGAPAGLFQILTTIWDRTGEQKKWFRTYAGGTDLRFRFLRGSFLRGVTVGGNLRCFLKLAGTPYFPSLSGKILVLEAMGGRMAQMITYLTQLSMQEGFRELSGLLLGTFTELTEAGELSELIAELLAMFPDIPIGQTEDLGHGKTCRPLMIGEVLDVEKGKENDEAADRGTCCPIWEADL